VLAVSLRSSLLVLSICVIWATASDGSADGPDIPGECKTLSDIVLDIKAPLNRKLEELRKTYGIREVTAGGLTFTDESDSVVLAVESSRFVNADKTQRVEEFTYRNRSRELILREKVITRGEHLQLYDFERRLFQTGIENYDLNGPRETMKEATLEMGGPLFRVVTTRMSRPAVDIKQHQVFVGEGQPLEITDTIHRGKGYRTYEYRVLESQIIIPTRGHFHFGWSPWQGTFRVDVREVPGLHLPEVTYERSGTPWAIWERSGGVKAVQYAMVNGSERFSRELHENLLIPFIEGGPVHVVKRLVEMNHLWPTSDGMQSIGSDSRYLNELIVLRNEVNQAKTNPAVLSLVEVKLNVMIKNIQEGSLRINDFR